MPPGRGTGLRFATLRVGPRSSNGIPPLVDHAVFARYTGDLSNLAINSHQVERPSLPDQAALNCYRHPCMGDKARSQFIFDHLLCNAATVSPCIGSRDIKPPPSPPVAWETAGTRSAPAWPPAPCPKSRHTSSRSYRNGRRSDRRAVARSTCRGFRPSPFHR